MRASEWWRRGQWRMNGGAKTVLTPPNSDRANFASLPQPFARLMPHSIGVL
jgi:hypothetical protein